VGSQQSKTDIEGLNEEQGTMRMSRTTATGVLAATALVMSVAGCSSTSSPSTTKSASATSTTTAEFTGGTTSGPSSSALAQPSDYTGLLIQVTDIDAPIPFTAGPPTANPNGQPGAAITFSSQPHPEDQNGLTVHEVHIRDTIQVLPDPAAAAEALNSAKAGQESVVKDPKTDSADVGSGGIMLSGKSPDGSKGVAVLLFAEGRALVTLEFDGPVDSLPPPDFVNGVGQKQAAAIKKGLGS
jgi:type 1 fimbria pilin